MSSIVVDNEDDGDVLMMGNSARGGFGLGSKKGGGQNTMHSKQVQGYGA